MLLLEVQDDASAMMFATNLGQHLAEPISIHDLQVAVGVSIGVSRCAAVVAA